MQEFGFHGPAMNVSARCASGNAGHCQAAVATAHPQLLDGTTERRPGPTVKSSLGVGGQNSVIVLDR